MQTRAKATQVFEVRMWSKKHFGNKLLPYHQVNIYNGLIIDAKSKEKHHFHGPGDFLQKIEALYKKAEKRP